MFKKIAILLGVDTVQSSKFEVQSFKHRTQNIEHRTAFKGILFGLLLISSIWYLGSAVTPVHALVISTNTANVDWTDDYNSFYATNFDTAVIRILAPPNLTIAKDVRNLRTGETSTDVVQAIRSDTVEFTLSIVNSGDTEARNTIVIDSVPIGMEYMPGSASDTASNDPVDPAQIMFQHISGGEFDTSDTGPVTAMQWKWVSIDGIEWYNKRTVKFRVWIKED